MPTIATVLHSALDAIGNTPLIRLDRLAAHEGLECNLLAKVEFPSAGGSVKDRIAKRMIEEAERDGRLIPNKSIIIEPTSGNTGIGLAMAGAIKGYPVVITLPEKMSLEKEAILRSLGAEVVRTPTEAAWDAPESHIGIARKLEKMIPGGIILDQYGNPNNPLAHYYGTGPEIIKAIISTPSSPGYPSSGKVDVFIAGAGTGGTVTGTARVIKDTHNSSCIVVGVDPKGSILALPSSLNDPADTNQPYVVEGIGYDFIPDSLTREDGIIDSWIKSSDAESFAGVKDLMRREGLLVGGSSGSALAGALKWLGETEEGRRIAKTKGANVVILLPDGIRNYIGKSWFLDIALNSERTPLGEAIAAALKENERSNVAEREARISRGVNEL